MSEEEFRRCCILGGCGCSPPARTQALAEELAFTETGAKGDDLKRAAEDPRYLNVAKKLLDAGLIRTLDLSLVDDYRLALSHEK